MGAWAFKLFTCDYDLDLIHQFNREVGLPALQQQHSGKKAPEFTNGLASRAFDYRMLNKGSTTAKVTQFPTSAAKEAGQRCAHVHYSLYAKMCSHPDVVRKHLDDGVLAKVTVDLLRKIDGAHDWFLKDCYGPGYQLCIMGACAMTLGAKLSNEHRDAMRAVYKDCEFMRDAILQLEAALEDDTGYVNGVPWDFGSPSMADGEWAPQEDRAFPATKLINVLGPDHGRMEDEMESWRHQPMLPTATAAEIETTIRNISYDPFTDEMMAR